MNESGTVWLENLSSTGCNTETEKVDKLDCGDLVIDKINVECHSYDFLGGHTT